LLGMALFDTCTDGFALDITPPGEMGKVQGIMVGGRALGIVIISATVGFLSQFTNWHAVFIALVIMTLIPLPLVFFMKEPKQPPALTFHLKAFRSLGNRAVIGVGLFGVISTLITGGANQLINPFLQESFGISYLAAGLFASVLGIGVIFGGMMGGRLSDRFGNKRAITGALITAIVAVSLLGAINGSAMTWALMLFFGFSYGYYQTVFFATSMSVTDPRIAASMYAILMAMSNLGSGIGLSAGGWISDAIGFRSTFLFFAALNLLVLPLLPLIFRKKGPGIEEKKILKGRKTPLSL
jgi:MFS transporter, PAT family, beta-lactamase induction signal transducer AmpG